MAKTKRVASKRYKNPDFLMRLGQHCRQQRVKHGYSIDRMAREGDQLSAATIHRLETGTGDIHISALFRYAKILRVPLKRLLDFQMPESDDE